MTTSFLVLFTELWFLSCQWLVRIKRTMFCYINIRWYRYGDPNATDCATRLLLVLRLTLCDLHHRRWAFVCLRLWICRQCFDTDGWASERASGLWKLSDEVFVWLSVWSEVQIVCMWSSWCHCHPQTLSSLASFKFRLVLPFWYRLTQVVLEKRPLNSCSSSSSSSGSCYPRESFREGLWNHRRTFVCLSVSLLPR